MDEDSGVSAPLTRLRRRLSVEQLEDTNSPRPATPTKKRGGKPAKPQLELIDENVADSSFKSATKKVKDLVEAADEKVATPSRRNTRVKSNSSIISETQVTNSPRAKRAARRNSQIGSDNETIVTPARQTRRTRKDSTSSMDKQESMLSSVPSIVTTVIEEESDNKSLNVLTEDDNVSLRKSPRLLKKRKSKENKEDYIKDATENDISETKENADSNYLSKTNLNISNESLIMINKIDKKPSKSSHLNRSTTSIVASDDVKKERHRTKSLTSTYETKVNKDTFYSNRPSIDKNTSTDLNSLQTNLSGYGDNAKDNTGKNAMKSNKNDASKNNSETKIKLNSSDGAQVLEVSISSEHLSAPLKNDLNSKSPMCSPRIEKNKENTNTNSTVNLLSDNPSTNTLQSTVFFEDSDSETKRKNSNDIDVQVDSGDQCVPEVETGETLKPLEKQNMNSTDENQSTYKLSTSRVSINNSCEPMDVDVTIPNNLVCEVAELENPSERKSESLTLRMEDSLKKHDKSKEILLTSLQSSQQQIENENKSTLIISQIKDTSYNENNVSKTPSKLSSEHLSKSASTDISKLQIIDKKNLSLDYSTSTPIQQKKLHKIGMHINSSIIDSTSNKNDKKKSFSKSSKCEISQQSGDSTEEDSSSQLLDNEADVAEDDYESGDSQNESERQYEEENEIREKGETLDSDDDISNDTDYEKDSFVVSSNEDDDELLSGSGDDLSLSANELTMSKNSKKKYDKRKSKEQKKASREMYQSRHKLNESDQSLKKSTRRLESSDDSDEDKIAPVGKNKQRRLNSTHEDSAINSNLNESISKKTYSNPISHSTSLCNVSVNKEQELSITMEDHTTQDDPLAMKIKLEPKTPLKDLNISTVQIRQNIEEVELDRNASLTKTNQTQDPLGDAEFDDDSSISENSEIARSYDSVLNQLNTKNKVKTHNHSLNLNKKIKQKPVGLIVDQLNLTSIKTPKKIKKPKAIDVVDAAQPFDKNPETKKNTKHSNTFADNYDSSDSINMQLLFSEDSCDVDIDTKLMASSKKSKKDNEDDFIPLKRTPGKVNILSNADDLQKESNSQNKETPKKQQRMSEVSNIEDNSNDEIRIVVDTQGSRGDFSDSMDISVNTSLKKKKKKKQSLDALSTETNVAEKIELDTEVLGGEIPQDNSNLSLNASIKKKKKKKHSMNESSIEAIYNEDIANDDAPTEVSFKSTKKDKKRKSNIDNEEHNADVAEKIELDTEVLGGEIPQDISNVSLNASMKKKKKKKHSMNESSIEAIYNEDIANENVLTEVSFKSNKKDKKRKSDKGTSNTDTEENNIDAVTIGATDPNTNSAKKKKKHRTASGHDLSAIENDDDNTPNDDTEGSRKNPKKIEIDTEKIDKSLNHEEETQDIHSKVVNMSLGKNIKKHKQVYSEEETGRVQDSANSKKRKRKSSAGQESVNENAENIGNEPILDNILSLSTDRLKKKIKVSENTELVASEEGEQKKKPKKRKRSKQDDSEELVSKILKENSFDKVHSVPRLPDNILSKLDDKPRKKVIEQKKSVISTTNFVIEPAKIRKNKPSNFLEESVYLNASPVKKKQTGHFKQPKVLPFVPTATTSCSGFTTSFKINVLPKEIKFVAQTNTVANFKNDYLYGKKIKRLNTYEIYKKNRTAKVSKF